MSKYASYCVFIFLISTVWLFSGCPLYAGKHNHHSFNDSFIHSNQNVLHFFNNPCFIATEYSLLSNKKTEVLLGEYSLKGESGRDEPHAVFLYTDKKELPLHSGKTYTVSFDYRILHKGHRGFEVLFYSPSAAEKKDWLDSFIINPDKGFEGTAGFTCTLKNYSDYMIYWSIVDGGSIVIDNIKLIEENSHTVFPSVDIEAERMTVNVNRETIAEKISNKATIPVFYPWIPCQTGGLYDRCEDLYGLVWTRRGLARDIESSKAMLSGMEIYRMQRDTDTLYLVSPDWHAWTPAWQELSRRSNFYLNEIFKPHIDSEYPMSLMINFEHREWPLLMAEKVFNYKRAGFDGIMLDWWNNEAGNGRNKKKVESVRLNLIKQIRKKVGDNFIVMGNVNWNTDDPSEPYLSGVFAELWKPSLSKTYAIRYEDENPEAGYFSIERLKDCLLYWDSALRWPKIIAVEAWKLSDEVHVIEDFEDYKNYKMAKLFAAMTCVIPENGYFLYADNNSDKKESDHDHVYYDFYRTDFGKSISGMHIITEGAAYKEYERGFIAYNRNSVPIEFYTKDGKKISLHALEGSFIAK